MICFYCVILQFYTNVYLAFIKLPSVVPENHGLHATFLIELPGLPKIFKALEARLRDGTYRSHAYFIFKTAVEVSSRVAG